MPSRALYDGHADGYEAWNKPRAARNASEVQELRAHPTYRLAGWHQEAPWWGEYVRKRVGMRHHPLADLLNAFIGTGLVIEHIAELSKRPVPIILGILARKPQTAT